METKGRKEKERKGKANEIKATQVVMLPMASWTGHFYLLATHGNIYFFDSFPQLVFAIKGGWLEQVWWAWPIRHQARKQEVTCGGRTHPGVALEWHWKPNQPLPPVFLLLPPQTNLPPLDFVGHATTSQHSSETQACSTLEMVTLFQWGFELRVDSEIKSLLNPTDWKPFEVRIHEYFKPRW